jgi:RimK family alpha-L-glutamate ligase
LTTIPSRVAILSRTPSAPNVRRLVEAVESRGGVALPGLPGAASADAADVWLTRLGSGTPPHELEALEALGTSPWVNDPASLRVTHSKLRALCRLRDAGLPVPATLAVHRDGPCDLSGLPGERFVVKPPTGQAGRGVVVGVTRDQASARARAFADLSGSALVQPWLGEGVDRRVFLVGDEPVAGMERRPAADGRGNVAQGGEARAWTPPHDALALAREARGVLGLDVAGVDLLEHQGQTLILEVNACPGFTAIEAVTGRDVAGAVASLAMERAAKV